MMQKEQVPDKKLEPHKRIYSSGTAKQG